MSNTHKVTTNVLLADVEVLIDNGVAPLRSEDMNTVRADVEAALTGYLKDSFGFPFSVRRNGIDRASALIVSCRITCSGEHKAYEKLVTGESLTFGQALVALKAGMRVTRKGWNGRHMYLLMVEPEDMVPTPGPRYEVTGVAHDLERLPWIGMKTADNKFVPWLASQTDVLAEDWVTL
jgi:hypothetical protein